jgi:hypothetical protein
MLNDLEAIRQSWKPSIVKIAPVLIALEPYFKVYIEYCKKYYKGLEILKPIRYKELFKTIETYSTTAKIHAFNARLPKTYE